MVVSAAGVLLQFKDVSDEWCGSMALGAASNEQWGSMALGAAGLLLWEKGAGDGRWSD